MTRDDAIERITFLAHWRHFSYDQIGEQIGLNRRQVRAIVLDGEEINDEAAQRLEGFARREGFYERMAAGR